VHGRCSQTERQTTSCREMRAAQVEPLLGTGEAVRYERFVRARALIAEITSVLASAYAFISSNS
jgi:hypothetical protein